MKTLLSTGLLRQESGKAKVTALNSLAIYLLAYLLVQGLSLLATVAMALRLHIPLRVYTGHVQFLITNNQWWRQAVLAVYGAGPLLALAVGVGCALLFWYYARGRRGRQKLFYFWVALHALNQVLGGLMAGCFTHSGFWYVPRWFWVGGGHAFPVALALGGGLLALVLGYVAAIPFLQSHDSRTLLKYANRPQLMLAGVVAPWLLGSLFISLLKFPDLNAYELLQFFTLGLFLIPLMAACRNELFSATVAPATSPQSAGRLRRQQWSGILRS